MNLLHFLSRSAHTKCRTSFFAADQFPLDDESIADIAINAMLLVMNNSTRALGNNVSRIEDYAPLVASGVRFPWKNRITLSSYVDTLNDTVPNYATVGLTRKNDATFAQALSIGVVKPGSIPKSSLLALNGAGAIYRTTYTRGFDGLSRSVVKGKRSNDIESIIEGGYAGIMPDGTVIGISEYGKHDPFYADALSYVVSIYNDRRHFWEVTAIEEFWENFPAKAIFSIDEEFIKSLFYARSIPMTASGRLRPILHWVSAHQRRIKEGVDVDVKKHMRGIDAFSMHGVRFHISEPRK